MGVTIVKKPEKSDPASVVYDAGINMSETANFNMKLPKSMKDEAQATFKSMGMDMATAIR